MKFISKEDGLEYYTHDDVFYDTFHEPYQRETHNRHDRELTCIGSFEYTDDVIAEETLGTRSGTIEVYVNSNEGDYAPHMHFKSTDGKIDGCVKIENAEYFSHGKFKSRLTEKQAKDFYKFMKSKSKNEHIKPFKKWDVAALIWESETESNNNHELVDILEIPRYYLLNHPEYYRYTIDDIGIYEYVRRNTNPEVWDFFMITDCGNWLKTPDYDKYKSMKAWFKKEGFDMFHKYTYEILRDLVPEDKQHNIKLETKEIAGTEIHYSDQYQILVY